MTLPAPCAWEYITPLGQLSGLTHPEQSNRVLDSFLLGTGNQSE
jgi:hypothetical protein